MLPRYQMQGPLHFIQGQIWLGIGALRIREVLLRPADTPCRLHATLPTGRFSNMQQRQELRTDPQSAAGKQVNSWETLQLLCILGS